MVAAGRDRQRDTRRGAGSGDQAAVVGWTAVLRRWGWVMVELMLGRRVPDKTVVGVALLLTLHSLAVLISLHGALLQRLHVRRRHWKISLSGPRRSLTVR